MSIDLSALTRRAFLTAAAKAGVVSALAVNTASGIERTSATQLSRRTNFDGGWKFSLGDVANAHSPDFQDNHWRALDLPHDWSIEGDFSPNAPAGGTGAYLPTGIGWYRKQFKLPKDAEGKRICLEFDGVYQRSEVWINGKSLGFRPYGFSTFSHDLTAHLAPTGTLNSIAVRVDNSLQPNCRWYTGSGIYRHVWLTATHPVHIAPWGTCVRTPSVSADSAEIEITTRILNETSRDAAIDLVLKILDSNGNVVQKNTASHVVGRDGDITLSQTFRVDTPSLWSTETPTLYTVKSILKSRAMEIDRDTTAFGIRSARFDADRGFLLNGHRMKLRGVCIHGDGGSVGTAVPERVWERRFELLKTMGCNAIRLTHNPAAPELIDMLDRMGFLVMAEAFDEWRQPKGQTPQYGYHKYFDEWSGRDLSAMIERDRNHPSIVIWSAGNEVPDQSAPEGIETLRKLMAIIRGIDPTRPITVACDQIAAEPKQALPGFLEMLDVVGYNYVDRWRDRREKYYSIDRQAYPNRRFIGTESSALYGSRGVYAVDQSNDLFFEKSSNTEIELEQQEKFIETYDYVSGDFIWTGIDYLGESHWPSKLASTGPLDTCGFVKDNYYFYQSIWTTTPVLHLQPHWNWQGKEGQAIPVICYTNCDTVELFLNGKSMGLKGFALPRPGMTEEYGHYPLRARALQTTADLHLSWDVTYEPGTLSAIGTKDGKVIATAEVHTTGTSARLALSVDRKEMSTAPSDVAHVTVEVFDAAGLRVSTADNEIEFTCEGAGRILGVDNGRPDSHESYKGKKLRAFNGMALVILQSTGMPGEITLTASSASLASSQIRVACNGDSTSI